MCDSKSKSDQTGIRDVMSGNVGSSLMKNSQTVRPTQCCKNNAITTLKMSRTCISNGGEATIIFYCDWEADWKEVVGNTSLCEMLKGNFEIYVYVMKTNLILLRIQSSGESLLLLCRTYMPRK